MAKQLTGFITPITRTSSRLGETFALNILALGNCVIATAGYEVQDPGSRTLELDVVASREVIDVKARDLITIRGAVDVPVNNA
jgi:hypothetical protein